MSIIVNKIVCGPLQNNMYIVRREDRNDAVVIDPADADTAIDALTREGIESIDILLTHGHFDHIMGVDALRKKYHAPVWIMRLDAPMLTDEDKNLGKEVLRVPISTGSAEHEVENGDQIECAGMTFRVMHTPGHTRGGACFLIENHLFSGDTLFHRSAGRFDFEGGSLEEILDSLQKLFDLSEEYRVYPGHGAETTLEFERKNNDFVRRYGR